MRLVAIEARGLRGQNLPAEHVENRTAPQLEIALRGWASQDDQVRNFQQRIDQQRLNYLKDIYFEMTHNEAQALTLAQMLMTIYIGSQQIFPPLSKPQLEQVYLEFERLFRDL